MRVGYARTSTSDQEAGLEAQVRDLGAVGCEEIFAEQVSLVAQRTKLKEAITFNRKGNLGAVEAVALQGADLAALVVQLRGTALMSAFGLGLWSRQTPIAAH